MTSRKVKIVRSPLRYPGGKSKALEQIERFLPAAFSEYREPFVGGGSLFIRLRQLMPHARVWINDLNPDLYCFWKCAQSDLKSLTAEVARVKTVARDGRKLFQDLTANYDAELSGMERAVRFFVLNRITFSGTVDAGGYSQKAFESRFTESSVKRLGELRDVLEGVRITNLDYREVLRAPGDGCFVFLDPPYLSAAKSKLYGRRGRLHSSFNHDEFAESLKACSHKWLVTYDDSPEIRNNFPFANIYEWELQYGMNNFGRDFAPKGKELFITNYEVNARETQQEVKLASGS